MKAPWLLKQIHFAMFRRDTCPPQECEIYAQEIEGHFEQLQLLTKKDMAFLKAGAYRLYPDFVRKLNIQEISQTEFEDIN